MVGQELVRGAHLETRPIDMKVEKRLFSVADQLGACQSGPERLQGQPKSAR